MGVVHLVRFREGDQGTLGFWFAPDNWWCYSLELPDRQNKPNISRVLSGVYDVVWARSGRYGWKYLLKDVPGRTWVRAHSGNYAGDKYKGYKTHSAGCILLGNTYGTMEGQLAVFSSKTTIRRFEELMDKKPFRLHIHDVKNGVPLND